MADVEFMMLGEFDPDRQRRHFDAVSFEKFCWQGLLRYEEVNEGEVVVYSSREDPLGNELAYKPGSPNEVSDPELARQAIAKAIVECFDHRTTVEVIPDDNGEWIRFETDT